MSGAPKTVDAFTAGYANVTAAIDGVEFSSSSGTIDSGVLSNLDDESLNEVIGFIKNKEFSKMRKWVALNIHNDPQAIYRKIYDSLFTKMENNSIPQAIIILSDYTYKSAFVADQEVNMVACMTELMMECKIK